MPASAAAIADGALSFSAGRIVHVGKNADVPTPPGADEIDVSGKVITPGLIDAHSHLGVYGAPESTQANSDGNEATAPVTAEVAAEHGFWPQDPQLQRAAAGGITAMLVLPGSANLIGGRGFPVKLHFGRTALEMRFPGAPDALKMACGENPKRVYGKDRRIAPSTRMGNVAGYRQAFADARDYANRVADWQHKHDTKADTAGPPPKRDLKLETLAAVLRGDILVEVHCYRADEMETMLRIADEFGFRIRAFHHALEGYKVRDVLVRKDVAIATWADWWGFKLEMWDGIPENAGLMTEAGGRAVIHSDSAIGIQRLNQEAAKAMWRARASGISVTDEHALRWITLNAAWVMGVDAQTGSLQPGKMADLVVWNGNPFSVYARAERTYVDGMLTFDSRTGPSTASDFEVGRLASSSARLVGTAASRPTGLGAPCVAASLPCQEALSLDGRRCVVFHNATVVDLGNVTSGTEVLIDGGHVVRVGVGSTPQGCRSVDASGLVLTAGLIDADSALGLSEVPAEPDANDEEPRQDEAKQPVHASARAVDSFDPLSATLPVARGGGVTSFVTAPKGGLVSGQSAWAATDGSVRKSPVGVDAHLGGPGGAAVQGPRGYAVERLSELLDDARTYAKRRQDFESNRMRKVAASRLDLEALQPVLSGAVPLVVTVNRVADIRATLTLAKRFGIRVVVSGGAEAWQVGAELAQAKVPVILNAMSNLPLSFDELSSREDSAMLLTAAGVNVLLSPRAEPHMTRTLAQDAGNAVAWGLSWGDAMRSITSNVASVFGLSAGRVAPGARADLVLWNGDPLEVWARPLALWVDGHQVTLKSRQTALLEKYRTLP
jgi:imidazolonepropionase-like amidohydrolase